MLADLVIVGRTGPRDFRLPQIASWDRAGLSVSCAGESCDLALSVGVAGPVRGTGPSAAPSVAQSTAAGSRHRRVPRHCHSGDVALVRWLRVADAAPTTRTDARAKEDLAVSDVPLRLGTPGRMAPNKLRSRRIAIERYVGGACDDCDLVKSRSTPAPPPRLETGHIMTAFSLLDGSPGRALLGSNAPQRALPNVRPEQRRWRSSKCRPQAAGLANASIFLRGQGGRPRHRGPRHDRLGV
jgi:hypothetical protein